MCMDALAATDQGNHDRPPEGNLGAAQPLLGHQKIDSTVRYLGIDIDDARSISEQVEI